jgi:hypothetical protein
VMHAFVLHEPPDAEQPPFVLIEFAHGEVAERDPRGVELYSDRLARLRQMAVFGDDARALLASIARTA